MRILIDGYNLIAAMPATREFFRRNIEKSRIELRSILARFKKSRGHSITVVFDGQGGDWGEGKSSTVSGIREVFTAKGEIADEVIIRMARSNPAALAVVTNDREVGLQCAKAGAAVLTVSEFESKLIEAVFYSDKGPVDDSEERDALRPNKKGPSQRLNKKERYKEKIKKKI